MRGSSAWVLIVLSSLVACGGGAPFGNGCGGSALAELIDAQGAVERDFAASVGQWSAAEVGASLDAGDGLRTGAGATAMLRVGKKGRVHVESETTIRLSRGGAQGQAPTPEAPPALEIERGQARVEAGDEALALQTDLGQAVLSAGGSMTLARAEQGTRYRVVVGSASFEGKDGTSQQVKTGESIVVGLALAVIEPIAAGASAEQRSRAGEAQGGPSKSPGVGAVTAVVEGAVRRRGADDEQWATLEQGRNHVAADDELEVGESARASLERGEERAILSAGRYQVGAADAPIVRALDGNVRVETVGSRDVRISVPGGVITALAVQGGTRAQVEVRGSEGRADIRVERGQVTATGGEAPLELAAGESGELIASADAQGEHEEGESDERASDAHGASSLARVGRNAAAPDHAELIVTAGEFFRVYDPKPPTSIGFKLGKHCGDAGAEVRVDREPPARGREQVNVAVGPGLHNYTVHCLENGEPSGKPALRSTLRIVRSDGARKLPTTPPENEVALDGRRYTLMYQNLKPVLTARWPGAPSSTGYVLHVSRPGGSTLSMRSTKAVYVLKPGVLKDGTHRLQFESSGKTKAASKETLVDVVFDNAAPTASLELPAPGGFARAKSVTVAGVAVEDSRVSVAGTELKLDANQRFRSEVALRGDEHAIAVRVQHPRHGIRYFLRRMSR